MNLFATQLSTAESLLQLIGVSVLFIFVLFATYITTKFVGGVKLGQYKNSNFKVLETYRISQNKFLQIITVGKRYFVISVSKDDINIIAELEEADLLVNDEGSKPIQVANFSDIIGKLTNKHKENEQK